MAKKVRIDINQFNNKEFLIDRLKYYLSFAKNAIEHLIIKEYSLPKDSEWYVRPEKIIAETSYFLLYAKAGLEDMSDIDEFNDTLSIINSLSRNEKMLINIALNPALVLDYGHAHLCLTKMGYPNYQFDKLIDTCLKQDYFIERRPYRALEQLWLLSHFNGQANTSKIVHWFENCILNKRIDLFSKGTDMAYALTHAVMYLKFDGLYEKLPVDRTINQTIESLTIKYIDKQDYDVAGELIISWLLLNNHLSESIAFAIYCLFKVDNVVGFLPAPNLNTRYINDKELSERRTYIYSINYHTAYVMGMLISLLLRRKNLQITREYKNFGTFKSIVSEVVNSNYNPHWNEIYRKIEFSKKKSLESWIIQVAIFRYFEKHQYSKLKSINIELSNKKRETKDHELYKQTDELLHRLSQMESKDLVDDN